MPDREKVIRSIDCITRNAQDKPCNGCMCFRPFTDDPDTGWCDRNAALKDALKLLRRYNAEDAHAAIMDAPTVGGWISVNERLPEKPGRYLVCTSTITKVAWFLLSLKANPQFEYENIKFTVLESTKKIVTSVKLEIIEQSDDEDDDD